MRTLRQLLAIVLLFVTAWNPVPSQAQPLCDTRYCLHLPVVVDTGPLLVGNVRLTNGRQYTDLTLTGAVFNSSTVPLYRVRIEKKIYNGDGVLLATVTGSTYESEILPQTTNTFQHEFQVGYDFHSVSLVLSRVVGWSATPGG